jgi:hypothetical protein
MPEGYMRNNFSAARKQQHQKAYDNLQRTGWLDKYHDLQPHLKSEILRQVKDPRLVSCPKWQEHAAYFGPFMLMLSKALSRSWNKCHWIMYTSGARCEDISDFILYNCERIGCSFELITKIAADQSRQDAHVNPPALSAEEIYLALLGLDPVKLRQMNRKMNYGKSRCGVTYTVPGTRSTGVSATSVCNSMMNALMTLQCILNQIGEVDLDDPPFCIIIQGDDSLVLIDPMYDVSCDIFVSDCGAFGFKVKFVTKTTKIYEVDYCSRYFWPADDHPLGYVLAPKIGKVINKISCCRHEVKCAYSHNKAVCLSLYNDVNHVPFLRVLVKHLLRLTDDYKEVDMPYDFSLHSRAPHDISFRTWDFCHKLYGLNELDENEFDITLGKVNCLPYRINLPWLENALEIDY